MKELYAFFRYVGVGVVMLIFSLLSFYITLEVYQLPLYPTYIVTYFIAIFISYVLNSKFTFKKEQSKEDAFKYYLVYGLGMIIGISLLKLFSYLFDVSNFVLVLLILVPRTLITYILSRIFVFNNNLQNSTK